MSASTPFEGANQDRFDELFNELVACIEPEDDPDRMFKPTADGRIEVALDAHHRDVFTHLVEHLRVELADDGVLVAVLYPVAYGDDVAAQAAFVDTTHAQLRDGRIAAAERVLATVDGGTLDADDADAWLRVTNALRILLTQGVRTDADMERFYASGSMLAFATALCGAIQHYLLEALDELGL